MTVTADQPNAPVPALIPQRFESLRERIVVFARFVDFDMMTSDLEIPDR